MSIDVLPVKHSDSDSVSDSNRIAYCFVDFAAILAGKSGSGWKKIIHL